MCFNKLWEPVYRKASPSENGECTVGSPRQTTNSAERQHMETDKICGRALLNSDAVTPSPLFRGLGIGFGFIYACKVPKL